MMWILVFFLGLMPAQAADLSIYVYDSLDASGGLGREIVPLFEKKCGCTVRLIPSGDAGAMVGRIKIDLDRGKPAGQLVWGIDQNLWAKFQAHVEPWGEWKPQGYQQIQDPLRVGLGFLPFDYSVYAWIADTHWFKERKIALPQTLGALLDPKLKRALILEHPRTSTPGLAFVHFIKNIKKEEAAHYWTRLVGQWLTLAPGWDQAYGIFLENKAPLVWSYLTSQAYHREHGDSLGRYQALIFEEGQPFQIEGAAIIKGAIQSEKTRALARSFLEFLLTDPVQRKIPKGNWMFPVIASTVLPESFRSLPQAKKLVALDPSTQAIEDSIGEFELAIRAPVSK